MAFPPETRVDLFWLPLGAGEGGRCVRWNGRAFEAVVAGYERRSRCDLYHSALEVLLEGRRFVIEMAPVWSMADPDRGVVREGPVGLAPLGRSRVFRYEVRRWLDGVIPDASEAVDSPQLVGTDARLAQRVLELVPAFPATTWGRDELRAGEMWNSNSLVSWLLAMSGHDLGRVAMPRNGRAPGWAAGLVVAGRTTASCGPQTPSP